jgi:hypothetical protein
MKIERRRHLFSEQSPFSVGSHGGWAGRSPAASTPKGLKDQKDEKEMKELRDELRTPKALKDQKDEKDQKEMKELRDEIRTSKEMDKDQKDLGSSPKSVGRVSCRFCDPI